MESVNIQLKQNRKPKSRKKKKLGVSVEMELGWAAHGLNFFVPMDGHLPSGFTCAYMRS